jgi:glycosyltransferase involved in cell wall biosynthesis
MIRRVSVCITVFNEKRGVEALLDSLFNQTLQPAEIVICDGGSTDGTVEVIRRMQRSLYRFTTRALPTTWCRRVYARNDERGEEDGGIVSIRLYVSPGNVAHGRNMAIQHAKYPIIACIDAGCVAKKDWLGKLVGGLTNNSDIVAGFYEMKWRTPFQKIMALYRGTHPKRYDAKTFIPSCRSVAFTKTMWKDLGGFNETLSLSGEDTQFFNHAISSGYTITHAKNAIVEWKEPEEFTWRSFKKFLSYAKGDAQTKIWWDPVKTWRTHNIKILTIYLRYLFIITAGILLYRSTNSWISAITGMILLGMFYALWAMYKWRDVVTKWSERLWIPIVQIGTDIMVMGGFVSGIVR